MKSNTHSLGKKSARCNSNQNDAADQETESEHGDGEILTIRAAYHCHCSQFKPSDNLLSFMDDEMTHRRYKERPLKQQQEEAVKKIQSEMNREDDAEKEKEDLKGEVVKFKNAVTRMKKKRMDEIVKSVKRRKT